MTKKMIEQNRWLSVEEIAYHLGIKKDTAYKWVTKKHMPAHKVGTLLKFDKAEIDGEIKPLIMNLSPTSIKHWNAHKKKLQRSNLPVVATATTFSLSDVKKGAYRWAEVLVGIDGIASQEMLMLAKQARDQFEEVTRVISSHDFSDPGDTSVEPF